MHLKKILIHNYSSSFINGGLFY